MKVIKVTVDDVISVIDIDLNDWDSICEEIGGFEVVRTAALRSFFDAPVVMIVDDDGGFKLKEVNPIASLFYHGSYIVGDVLFVLEEFGEFVDFDDVDATCEYMNSFLCNGVMI